MVYVSGLAAVLVFVIAFERLRLTTHAAQAVEGSRAAMAVMRSQSLSDEEKARALQAESVALISGFASIVLRGAVATGLATLPMLAFQVLGLVTIEEASRWLLSWQAILLVSGFVAATFTLRQRT